MSLLLVESRKFQPCKIDRIKSVLATCPTVEHIRPKYFCGNSDDPKVKVF